MRQQVRVTVGMMGPHRQSDRLDPVGMGPVRLSVRVRDEGRRRNVVEVDPHDVDTVVMQARRVVVDRDPLLVRLVADAVVGGHEVGPAVVGRDPVGRSLFLAV